MKNFTSDGVGDSSVLHNARMMPGHLHLRRTVILEMQCFFLFVWSWYYGSFRIVWYCVLAVASTFGMRTFFGSRGVIEGIDGIHVVEVYFSEFDSFQHRFPQNH